MKFKKTLASLVAPVILAGSALFPQNSYSEIRSPQKVNPQTIQFSEKNPRFAGQVNMELYNRTLTGNRDIKSGNMPIYLEGEWNKEKGKLYFSYTAGRMTDEGPLLNQSSIKKARNLPLESIPKFDDPETEIYIISTTKDLGVGEITQKAFIHNARTNPLELRPLEEHEVGALAWWGLNKGYDWAMKKGDEMVIDYVSGGITKVVPYFGELPSKVQDKIIEKIPKPFEETKKFFDRRAQRMKDEGERDALSSLENAVYVQQFPLFPTFKNQVAKSFEVDLRNNSFDDEQVSIWIRNLSVGNKSNYGLLHGNVGDISMVVDLPSESKEFLGFWRITKITDEDSSPEESDAISNGEKYLRENYRIYASKNKIYFGERNDPNSTRKGEFSKNGWNYETECSIDKIVNRGEGFFRFDTSSLREHNFLEGKNSLFLKLINSNKILFLLPYSPSPEYEGIEAKDAPIDLLKEVSSKYYITLEKDK